MKQHFRRLSWIHHTSLTTLLVGLLGSFAPAVGSAQTPACKVLSSADQARTQKLFASLKGYDCCHGTIAECLNAKPTCNVAKHLADSVCRWVQLGEDDASIAELLAKRATSLQPPAAPVSFDLRNAPVAGDPQAPVTIVEYACATCPFCGRMTPWIHQQVTSGALKGKAKLYFRPFPLRGHEGSREANLGLIAAARLGRFWPYALEVFREVTPFQSAKQRAQAKAAGLDVQRFTFLLNDADTEQQLIDSKKEGIRNLIEATPTFYIQGRKYVGDLQQEELLDFLQEEYERTQRDNKTQPPPHAASPGNTTRRHGATAKSGTAPKPHGR